MVMTATQIATRAGRFAVRMYGDGPLLILVPAIGRAAADFAPLMPTLQRRFRVATLDWPSTGTSPAADRPEAQSACSLAEAFAEVAAALGDEPAVVFGHSLGGFAAARLAIDSPHRVRGLVLVDALGFMAFNRAQRVFCAVKGRTAVTRAVEGYVARAQTLRRNANTAGVFERVDAARIRPDYAELTAAAWRSFPDPANDLRRAAAAIRCPTLVCWGVFDPVIPAFSGRTAARVIPGARLALFPTGHTPFIEDPRGFARTLDPFLSRVLALQPRPTAAPA